MRTEIRSSKLSTSAADQFWNENKHLTPEDMLELDWYLAQATFRRYYIMQMIRRFNGNMTQAANFMRLDRGSLYRTVAKLEKERNPVPKKRVRGEPDYAPKRGLFKNREGLFVMPETTSDVL